MRSASFTSPIAIDEVKRQVEQQLAQSFTWFYSEETDSTNTELLKHKIATSIAITEFQSQGRGQRDHQWQSPHAKNLLFSIALKRPVDKHLGLIPIQVGLAIKSTLNTAGYNEIELKWPNDIFYKKRKLGGILIEAITEQAHSLLVIGVGLNVNMSVTQNDTFIALKQTGHQEIDRTDLLSHCITAIYNILSHEKTNTIEAFNNAHLFHLKKIRFKHHHKIINGHCQGINSAGQLVIKTPDGASSFSTGSIMLEQTCSH